MWIFLEVPIKKAPLKYFFKFHLEKIKCSLRKIIRQPSPGFMHHPTKQNKTIQYKTKQNKTPVVNVTKPYGRQLHDPSPEAISLPITKWLIKVQCSFQRSLREVLIITVLPIILPVMLWCLSDALEKKQAILVTLTCLHICFPLDYYKLLEVRNLYIYKIWSLSAN